MLSNKQPYSCRICGSTEHTVSKCTEIRIPPDGFFKPAGGGNYGGGDDEDDKLLLKLVLSNYAQYYNLLKMRKRI